MNCNANIPAPKRMLGALGFGRGYELDSRLVSLKSGRQTRGRRMHPQRATRLLGKVSAMVRRSIAGWPVDNASERRAAGTYRGRP